MKNISQTALRELHSFWLKLKDIASTVIFLSSDLLAGHITGEIVTIAGGMEGRLLHGNLRTD